MQERMEESIIYQLTLQEGFERGFPQGFERGKVIGAGQFLLMFVSRYDDADLLQCAQQVVGHCHNYEQLSQLVFQIIAASTRADVLALLSAQLPDAGQQ